ncbi:MAG: hypothetical protein AAGI54_12670, partial [Planctomycetota bacterium]
QLVFLRNLYPGERAITPQNSDSVGNDNPAENDPAAARIWYGHVVPTNNRGDNANDDPTNADYDFYNRPANQWTLGRQALYFTGANTGTPGKLIDPANDITTDDNTARTANAFFSPTTEGLTLVENQPASVPGGPSHFRYPAIDGYTQPSGFSIDWFNRMATSDADVVNSFVPATNRLANPELYMGLTDVVPAAAEHLFYTVFFWSSNPALGTTYAQGGPLSAQLNPDPSVASGAGNTDYATNAAELGYAFDRLWVNPRPHDAAGNPARLIEAWQQAQMHPYLAAGVSDFEVHFAGDYDDDDNPSNTPGVPDGQIDLDNRGNIRWYNSFVDGQNNLNVNPSDSTDDDIIVPPIKTDMPAGSESEVPIQRFAGGLNSTPDHADLVFVWRHDEPESWPDLIRIRYRIHDADGRISDRQLDTDNDGIPDENTAVPGRLVEVIFRVPG